MLDVTTSRARHRCAVCSRGSTFLNRESLRVHYRLAHHDTSAYECEACQKLFPSKLGVSNHKCKNAVHTSQQNKQTSQQNKRKTPCQPISKKARLKVWRNEAEKSRVNFATVLQTQMDTSRSHFSLENEPEVPQQRRASVNLMSRNPSRSDQIDVPLVLPGNSNNIKAFPPETMNIAPDIPPITEKC